MGKISDYAQALKSKLTDLFVVYQINNSELETKSVTTEQIGDAICGEQVHADLETDDQTIIGGINELAKDKNIADEYDDTHTYNTGDITIHENTLYICQDDNVTGAWDSTKWTATTIDDLIPKTDNNLPHYTGTPTAGSTAEAIGDLSQLTTTDKSSIVGAVNEVNNASLKASELRVIRETKTTNNNGTIDSNALTGGAIPLSRTILSAYSPEGYFVKIGYYSSRYTFDVYDRSFQLVRNTAVEICIVSTADLAK